VNLTWSDLPCRDENNYDLIVDVKASTHTMRECLCFCKTIATISMTLHNMQCDDCSLSKRTCDQPIGVTLWSKFVPEIQLFNGVLSESCPQHE
jgi:hypothetical protein